MVFSICVGFLFFSYRDTREEIISFLQEFKIVSLSLLFLHSLHTSHILTACIKKITACSASCAFFRSTVYSAVY